MIDRLFTLTRPHAAAFGLAAVTTLAVLSGLVMLADGYRADAVSSQAAAQTQERQVVVVGHAAPRS